MQFIFLRPWLLMPLALSLSLLVFVGLGWIIQSPIGSVSNQQQRFALNWVQLSAEPQVETLRPPPPPPPPEMTEIQPQAAASSSRSAAVNQLKGLDMALPAIDAGLDFTAPDLQGVGIDGQAETPVYREAPQYPRQALARRMEGWVELEFEVNQQGQVMAESIRIIDADPPHVFDRAARRAIARWRFASYEMHGRGSRQLRQRLEFRMEGDG
jgi:protein TonB